MLEAALTLTALLTSYFIIYIIAAYILCRMGILPREWMFKEGE